MMPTNEEIVRWANAMRAKGAISPRAYFVLLHFAQGLLVYR